MREIRKPLETAYSRSLQWRGRCDRNPGSGDDFISRMIRKCDPPAAEVAMRRATGAGTTKEKQSLFVRGASERCSWEQNKRNPFESSRRLFDSDSDSIRRAARRPSPARRPLCTAPTAFGGYCSATRTCLWSDWTARRAARPRRNAQERNSPTADVARPTTSGREPGLCIVFDFDAAHCRADRRLSRRSEA